MVGLANGERYDEALKLYPVHEQLFAEASARGAVTPELLIYRVMVTGNVAAAHQHQFDGAADRATADEHLAAARGFAERAVQQLEAIVSPGEENAETVAMLRGQLKQLRDELARADPTTRPSR